MKKIIAFAFLLIFVSNNAQSAENCKQYKKLSKNYLKCSKNNLKYKSDQSVITEKLGTFKSSKSLTDFFKKITEK